MGGGDNGGCGEEGRGMGRSEVPCPGPPSLVPATRPDASLWFFFALFSDPIGWQGFPFFSVVGVGFVYRGLIAYSLVFDGLVWATEQKLRLFVFLTA